MSSAAETRRKVSLSQHLSRRSEINGHDDSEGRGIGAGARWRCWVHADLSPCAHLSRNLCRDLPAHFAGAFAAPVDGVRCLAHDLGSCHERLWMCKQERWSNGLVQIPSCVQRRWKARWSAAGPCGRLRSPFVFPHRLRAPATRRPEEVARGRWLRCNLAPSGRGVGSGVNLRERRQGLVWSFPASASHSVSVSRRLCPRLNPHIAMAGRWGACQDRLRSDSSTQSVLICRRCHAACSTGLAGGSTAPPENAERGRDQPACMGRCSNTRDFA